MLYRYLILPATAILAVLLQGCATPQPNSAQDSLARLRTHQTVETLSSDDSRLAAKQVIPFARIAAVVWCDDVEEKQPDTYAKEDCKALDAIANAKWKFLYNSKNMLTKDEAWSGLKFMAFAREDSQKGVEIVIGFRGTNFKSLGDWWSNLRWVTRFVPIFGPDQYAIVSDKAKGLIDLAIAKALEEFPQATTPKIYTTGHSLGGGLAQLLAYKDTRVSGAIVFDSSPVTGYATLVSDAEINCRARVLRVYEKGEALQYVRNFTRSFYSLSENISELSFDFVKAGGNPIYNHSLKYFREGLESRANIGKDDRVDISGLDKVTDCECVRLRMPLARQTEFPSCQQAR